MEKGKTGPRSRARLPNPPKSPRITKALLKECRWVLNTIDWTLFLHRKLEAPALGIPDEWRMEVQERRTACRAHLNTWWDAEKKRRKGRRNDAVQRV
jgi:hypothetical protein